MRLSNSAHEAHAWRIREIAPDFRLEDVWALPVQGRIDDFAKLLDVIAALDPSQGASRAARALFSIRWRLGAWLGWDGSQKALPVPDNAETSLSARLPADLRGTATSPDFTRTPFTPIYRTEVEWAAELSNRTVHAVMHLGVGRETRQRLSGTDGRLCQAARSPRRRLHGSDRPVSSSHRVSGHDARHRAGLETAQRGLPHPGRAERLRAVSRSGKMALVGADIGGE